MITLVTIVYYKPGLFLCTDPSKMTTKLVLRSKQLINKINYNSFLNEISKENRNQRYD